MALQLQEHCSLLRISSSQLPPPKSPQTPQKSSQEPTFAAKCNQDPQLFQNPNPPHPRCTKSHNLGAKGGGALAGRAPPPCGRRALAGPFPLGSGRREGQPRVHCGGHRRLQQPKPLLRGGGGVCLARGDPAGAGVLQEVQGGGRHRRVPQDPRRAGGAAAGHQAGQERAVHGAAQPEARRQERRAGGFRRGRRGGDEGFLTEVKSRFPDPANTVVCVLDNFDGKSMKVAELLFNNGFKEAYAIKGGLRGPEGWQAIQENYLPPSVHVFPRKKKSKKSAYTDVSTNGTDDKQEGLTSPSSSEVNTINEIEDGHENPNGSTSAMKPASSRPLSSYPNYHDMKPPSSPTPSKPER